MGAGGDFDFDWLDLTQRMRSILIKPWLVALQPKQLRKLIQGTFKNYAHLLEEECVFQFFDILSKVWRFDQERFKCALGAEWSISVDLVVGPDVGISYLTEKASSVSSIVLCTHAHLLIQLFIRLIIFNQFSILFSANTHGRLWTSSVYPDRRLRIRPQR